MKNEELENLIKELKTKSIEEKVPFWKRIATDLEKPRKNKRSINVEKIDKVVKEGEIAVVPGKVIGEAKSQREIVAFDFSAKAKQNNKTSTLRELMKKNPKASKCRIVG
jgi:large subunit ribosomal protein L18e